jgi:nucleoside-diphosphate-sugar epimerase
MRVLVTGHNGYIGSVMVDVLARAGHDVVGVDTYLFEDCAFGAERLQVPGMRADVRDLEVSDLAGFDAVIHLAALSNDPLGNLNPQVTYDINHLASVRLARIAREAGVKRFLFASSCSLYGLAGHDGLLTEEADFNPVTPYGESKVFVERDVSRLANDHFSPIYLRNATAYGVSPRLRADIVVNSLVGYAFTTGEILMQSDGTPWRPLVHVEDISRAFLAALEAPRELIHNRAFNVGRSQENYQIREVAEMVLSIVPGSRVTYAPGGGPDPRCYRVNCDEIAWTLPAFQPRWTVRDGVLELYEAYRRNGLTYESFAGAGSKYLRIKQLQRLQANGLVDDDLRWTAGRGADPSVGEQAVVAAIAQSGLQ